MEYATGQIRTISKMKKVLNLYVIQNIKANWKSLFFIQTLTKWENWSHKNHLEASER